MSALDATSRDVEQTSRDITVAQWSVAAVVMAGSMTAGGFLFDCLGEPWWLGVITAAGIDAALAAWLLVSRRLRAVGITSPLGTALEITTGLMTLFLNIGAAAFSSIQPGSAAARGLLAVAHGFLPVVLVLLSLAGGQAQLQLLRRRQQLQAAEEAERQRQLDADRAQYDAEQAERQRAADAANERMERERQDKIRLAEIQAAEAAAQRDHERDQLAATLAQLLVLRSRLQRPRQRTTPAARQPRTPARAKGGRQAAPDLADLVRRARPLVLEQGMGRSAVARELGVSTHWARQAIEAIEAERRPHLVRAEA